MKLEVTDSIVVERNVGRKNTSLEFNSSVFINKHISLGRYKIKRHHSSVLFDTFRVVRIILFIFII